MDRIRIPGEESRKHIRVGIPRAFLYYRYKILWSVFFRELGIETVRSSETNRRTVEEGSSAAIDEMCLSMKIYLGHVKSLIGKCDCILVPRICDFGLRREMCYTFFALPDIVRNIFYESGVKILTYDVQVTKKRDEEKAMVSMAQSLGIRAPEARRAYRRAAKAQREYDQDQAEMSETRYKRGKGLKIVIAAHSYVYQDEYIGRPIIDYLKRSGVTVLYADMVDRPKAVNTAAKMSPTMKWELSREITGSLIMHHRNIDGVILLSVYPCALDSMVNDMLIHKNEIAHIPMLQLTLDAQTGMAGTETRLESFIDIIRMRKESERESK